MTKRTRGQTMGRSEGKAFEAEGTAMAKDLSKEEFHLHVQGTQNKKKNQCSWSRKKRVREVGKETGKGPFRCLDIWAWRQFKNGGKSLTEG